MGNSGRRSLDCGRQASETYWDENVVVSPCVIPQKVFHTEGAFPKKPKLSKLRRDLAMPSNIAKIANVRITHDLSSIDAYMYSNNKRTATPEGAKNEFS